jgi:ADP-ribose pyrophosphatase YjhB (NUDIX family)
LGKYSFAQLLSMPPQTAYLPHIAYDSVIFGFSGDQLQILIMEYHNTNWFALPGGFVRVEEDLNAAVRRGLRERTGLDNVYLEQCYTFGDVSRHDPTVMRTILEASGFALADYAWMLERFLSVAYYALIDYHGVAPRPDALSDSINWYPIDALPPLILDHEAIVAKALDTLRANLDRKLVGVNLLPERFTMKELQCVYEAILGEPLSRSGFQRKMLSLGILQRHEKRFSGQAHKAPYLYSFLER